MILEALVLTVCDSITNIKVQEQISLLQRMQPGPDLVLKTNSSWKFTLQIIHHHDWPTGDSALQIL